MKISDLHIDFIIPGWVWWIPIYYLLIGMVLFVPVIAWFNTHASPKRHLLAGTRNPLRWIAFSISWLPGLILEYRDRKETRAAAENLREELRKRRANGW